MILIWILVFSLAGTAGTLVAAALMLVSSTALQEKLLSALLSYAVGTLLAVAFLRVLPQALEGAMPTPILGTVLLGIVLFFILEKMLLWRHCHEPLCEIHSAGGELILLGDAFHNLVDGVLIAAAFLSSIPLGVATALAIIIHEVPQEVGDFSILIEHGYSKSKALLYNIFSSLATFPGALLGYLGLEFVRPIIPYVLALSASSFIYIATVDLIANMHRHRRPQIPMLLQMLFLFTGIATVALLGLNHHP